jgi:hypothetical protein
VQSHPQLQAIASGVGCEECLEFERCNLRTGFRGVSCKLGIQVDHRMSLKRGHSSLVDLSNFVFFLDYPVPLRVLR